MGKRLGEVLGGDSIDINVITNSSEIARNLTDYEYEVEGNDKAYYWALTITIMATLLLDFSAGEPLN